MASILFYTSIKTRVKDQESLMVEFTRAGHRVFFVNQQPNPYLPDACEKAKIHYETISYKGPRVAHFSTLFHIYKLIRFVRDHNINIIYSHLEPANFIAVLAQYFIRARVVVVRHHLDLAARLGFDRDLSYRLTYSLAREVIAVSRQAKKYMTEVENVDPARIHHIDLGYDFSVFGVPNDPEVRRLRGLHSGVILVSVGRFDEYKRFDLSIDVCLALLNHGIDCHLFLLGAGPDEVKLKSKILDAKLADRVEFFGYVDNVPDYLAAADWLLHPSVSESSCVVVKEAGLVNLPVVVCKGVGDFDDFLKNDFNAVVVDPHNFVNEAVESIIRYEKSAPGKGRLGLELGREVRSRFDIRRLVHRYDQFHS